MISMKINKILTLLFGMILLASFASAIDITNCTDLQAMENDLSADYVLTNNIDCSDTINWNAGAGFLPISYADSGYTGTFDGQGFNVSNLYINASTGIYGVGLFANTAGATIKNVGILNGTAISNVGGEAGLLAGYNDESNFSNCFSTGNVQTYNEGISGTGGLLGYFNGVTDDGKGIFNCYSTATVYALGDYAGGLGGTIEKTTIQNCYATGNVRGKDWSGGLAGFYSGNAFNSYATGDVQGNQYVGGFIGDNYYDEFTPITINCYSQGNVNGSNAVGGFIGNAYDVQVNNSYSTGQVTGDTATCGFIGGGLFGEGHTVTYDSFWDSNTSGYESCINGQGIAKTTIEMQTESTFTDAGWDFNNTWGINPNNYPQLRYFGFVQEEEEPPVVEETTPEYKSTPIYQVMDSSGAGLGRFIQYISQPLMLFIIAIVFIGIIVIIGSALVKPIREAIAP
jgi:hypothetical protein